MDKPTDLVEYETMLLGRHRHLDRSAYILLSRIRTAGLMSIGQLSEAFGLDVSTLNRHTSALLRTGLAERVPDPDGGIARKFRLTRAGERYLEEERAKHVSGLERVLAGWTAEEVAAFAACLRRFNADVERLGGRVCGRPARGEGSGEAC
ncbi:MarR family transcriptional regulator [Nonomuraea sp. 3-1Str]|uniref:MarR family winged helix-turn-helix transcriptional regulator n=1 Tax=Nonomuraea sp. 3-1Str TaxID=2929801 RepID=UPI00285CD4CC|nr:MarR family transcriptional regulator [Nonomuraea sp. 3-1Str]MDR8413282.1 MarR family transcriptional regulator [Nonomuraea sp. 3-1Str]